VIGGGKQKYRRGPLIPRSSSVLPSDYLVGVTEYCTFPWAALFRFEGKLSSSVFQYCCYDILILDCKGASSFVSLFLSSTSYIAALLSTISAENLRRDLDWYLCDWQTAAACDMFIDILRRTDEIVPHADILFRKRRTGFWKHCFNDPYAVLRVYPSINPSRCTNPPPRHRMYSKAWLHA
jgi:hypothetical protein